MLASIKQPSDLRRLSGDELIELAAEIRDFLVRAVAVRGGHLGPALDGREHGAALRHSGAARHRSLRARPRHAPTGRDRTGEFGGSVSVQTTLRYDADRG
jgi:hypothetical protein